VAWHNKQRVKIKDIPDLLERGLKMLKVNLTTAEKIEALLTEIIRSLGWAAVMFSAFIVLAALWIIFKPEIQEALRAAQGLMFG